VIGLRTVRKRCGSAVLRCLIELAHTLGLKVVAEGMETQDQSSLLIDLGCDQMQGYLLGMPFSSEYISRARAFGGSTCPQMSQIWPII